MSDYNLLSDLDRDLGPNPLWDDERVEIERVLEADLGVGLNWSNYVREWFRLYRAGGVNAVHREATKAHADESWLRFCHEACDAAWRRFPGALPPLPGLGFLLRDLEHQA